MNACTSGSQYIIASRRWLSSGLFSGSSGLVAVHTRMLAQRCCRWRDDVHHSVSGRAMRCDTCCVAHVSSDASSGLVVTVSGLVPEKRGSTPRGRELQLRAMISLCRDRTAGLRRGCWCMNHDSMCYTIGGSIPEERVETAEASNLALLPICIARY